MPAPDDGPAISYKVLARGTPVHTSDDVKIGTVARVLDNAREQIFDGIVVSTESGMRFVDAPEVARISEQRVSLSIDAAEVSSLPEPDPGAPEFSANPKVGRVGRFFGGGWKRR